MRAWWIPAALVIVSACSDDEPAGPNTPPPPAPAVLSSVTLDGAIALTWSDNAYADDPSNFQNYRVYSTTYNLDLDECGSSFQLEGTTVAPEFLVGALANGVPRCFGVSAVSVAGLESARSQLRADTPRPDARNVALNVFELQAAGSGFRFWDDLNGDGSVQAAELGIVRSGASPDIDFAVDKDGSGALFLTPVRLGTGVEYYDENNPTEDLSSIDFAVDREYRSSPILARTGFGYVFEMDGGDGFKRYGAVRITHVGQSLLILDWAYQTDPGNPELVVTRMGARTK
jgi:hypothetical protein